VTQGDPTADRRTYYRNVATGERGYMVQRHGADHMKWDQPGHDRTQLFKADDWVLEAVSRQMAAHEVAQIAFEADRRFQRALGKLMDSRTEWVDLSNDERNRFIKEGPRCKPGSKRSRLWVAIVTVLTEPEYG
jgi:hypothetical protein